MIVSAFSYNTDAHCSNKIHALAKFCRTYKLKYKFVKRNKACLYSMLIKTNKKIAIKYNDKEIILPIGIPNDIVRECERRETVAFTRKNANLSKFNIYFA